MLSPWPWDDVTVQLNDASWRTSTSFHLLSTNTSRTQCATMSHPFSAHKGLLRPSGYAYGRFLESLPKPTIWECMDYANGPNANRTAQISYSESWKSFPRFQNCHLPMVVHHGIKRISALEPCASTMPGCMGRQLGGNGWTEETQENLRNHQKMIGNLCQIPFLHESLLDPTTLPPVSEPLFCQIHHWERPGQGHARCLQ